MKDYMSGPSTETMAGNSYRDLLSDVNQLRADGMHLGNTVKMLQDKGSPRTCSGACMAVLVS